jgi:hypothetical protein
VQRSHRQGERNRSFASIFAIRLEQHEMATMKKPATQQTRTPDRQGSIPKGREDQSSRKRGQRKGSKGKNPKRAGRKVGARPKRAPLPP